MTERNDNWIKLWDQVPAEHRWIFEQTNEHYNAAFGSMLAAVLKALANIEENQAAFSHPLGALVAKQELITEHLVRQDSAMEAVSTAQAELRATFLESAEHLDDRLNAIDARLAGLDTWRQGVDTELGLLRQQQRDLAEALESHVGEQGHLTQLIEAATARGRRKGKAEERANPGKS